MASTTLLTCLSSLQVESELAPFARKRVTIRTSPAAKELKSLASPKALFQYRIIVKNRNVRTSQTVQSGKQLAIHSETL